MEKIIVIEDDAVIREELENLLNRYGYEVKAITNFNNIIDYIEEEKAHLILLDINLPVFDGYYICREIRKRSEIPIIIVTSRDNQMDELMSMNLGADDFVAKPYNTQILLARISSILKRTYGSSLKKEQDIMSYKNISLNLSNGSITCNGKTLELTKNEIKILSYLIKNKGNIVSRESLMEYLWDSELFVDDNTLSVNVTRLRKKLEEIGMEDSIETRRGLGYIMP
ncbi:response regulator transcription factor [Clostridium chauvoei]|uniref:Stage 0 sporulation protein A homolog n=2 Tax=Clostridium chauvoei TaxID=46867 RepID=S6EWN2_9CLOT|nr:response regulator transcription factor [Clostridium chauvoei]ATD54115.1 DNA-binding response regulator [Clostridium chauvoei]ATD58438.1 DNA-binding response regulator [Clostridium chauvoei]MBX7281609.1 response regulator transcription factor [Clostridium chauvoei]MBX7284129.1 response regulator transcription factor [Clostridium chauvoei]MBX7286657.1 response regulator transcription factor [Clostridium chauvoei]